MKKRHFILMSSIMVCLMTFLFFFQSPSFALDDPDEEFQQAVYLPVVANLFKSAYIIEGVITDGRANLPVSDAEICLNDGQDCVLSRIDGAYRINNVPSGWHIITVDHPNFPKYTKRIAVPFDINTKFDVKLLPALEGDQWRVVLTWDSTPTWPPDDWQNNLELHLWLRNSDYYIYEGNQNEHVCPDNLEVFPYTCYESDEKYGSGPDSIVFVMNPIEEYSFGVLNFYDGYLGVPPITELDVVLEIFDSAGLIQRFTIDEVQGQTGDLWYVFDLSNGGIDPQNCLQQYNNATQSPPIPCDSSITTITGLP